MDVIMGIMIFITVVVITLTLFAGWFTYIVAKLLFRGLGKFGGMIPGTSSLPRQLHARCGNTGCGQTNPGGANFCRRCGRRVIEGQRVVVRRIEAA